MIDIEELKKLALAATPGPWNFSRESWNVSTPDCDLDICVYRPTLDDGETDDPSNLTGEFIAAVNPQTVLALLAENDALRKELEEARNIVRQLVAAMDKSVEVGCTDHLDCCDDAGAFWHTALIVARQQSSHQEPT